MEKIDKEKIIIKKINSINELKEAFENGFISLFDECFNAEPYFLKYSNEELWNIYENHFKTGFVIFAYYDNNIIGFAGSRPLIEDEYVSDDIKEVFDDINEYWYHSDIGVGKNYRRQGIAKILLRHTISNTPKNKKIIMRTNEANQPSIDLHKSMGFIELEGVCQVIKRINTMGKEIIDKRIYLKYEEDKDV